MKSAPIGSSKQQPADDPLNLLPIHVQTNPATSILTSEDGFWWFSARTLAWLNRNRRLAKDFEQTIASATEGLCIASVQRFARRIAKS